MTTVHDFFNVSGTFQTISIPTDPNAYNKNPVLEVFAWGDVIKWWLDNYLTKADFLAAAIGNVPPLPDFYYQRQYIIAGDQAGLLLDNGVIDVVSFDSGVMCGTASHLPPNATCEFYVMPPLSYAFYYSQFVCQYYDYTTTRLPAYGSVQYTNGSCSGSPWEGWVGGNVVPGPGPLSINGHENYINGGILEFVINRQNGGGFATWDISSASYIQLEDCKDINGLADYLYGGPTPIFTTPIFGMGYPPINPGPTDILIPQHTIPPLKRRIPFQNYTQSIPRMIKK